jgi:hypothetical protein
MALFVNPAKKTSTRILFKWPDDSCSKDEYFRGSDVLPDIMLKALCRAENVRKRDYSIAARLLGRRE